MWQITIKDLKVFFKDRKALFLALLLPVGLITLFALAFGGVTGNDDPSENAIVVLFSDEDNSSASKGLIISLDSIPGIDFLVSEKEEAIKKIQKGDELANIIFYKGFEDSLNAGKQLPVEMQFDKSRQMEIGIIQNLLVGRLSEMKGEVDAEIGIDRMVNSMFPNLPQEMQESVKQNIKTQRNSSNSDQELVVLTSIVGDEETNWGLIQAVAGTAIMMLLFSVRAIGESMLEEKENGVLKKLLQAPLHPYEIMMGKMMTATIISIFQLSVMFLFSWIVFGLDIFINLPALIIMIIITAIACSAFGVLLCSIVTSKKQADSLGTIIILFMSAIGGSMIPLYIMPVFMQNAAVVSLNYWSIQGFYDIFWRKTGMEGIIENIIVLSGIAIGVLSLSAYFFKKNILKLA
ncbi:MAG: ABC transporter permease [Chitinophagales bacterium]